MSAEETPMITLDDILRVRTSFALVVPIKKRPLPVLQSPVSRSPRRCGRYFPTTWASKSAS
jgi:hypothetical protein